MELDFYEKTETIAKAFDDGGFCASQLELVALCPKCGVITKSGKLSCCVPGGSWKRQCGNPSDSKFEHTWTEGMSVCNPQGSDPPPITTPPIAKPPRSRCTKCDVIDPSND